MKKMSKDNMRNVNGGSILAVAAGIAIGKVIGQALCPIVNKKNKAYC